MKKIITFKRASQVSLILFGIFILFHLAIIIGILFTENIPIDYLWGGRMETKEQLLVFEMISLVVMTMCFLIVMIRSGRIRLPKLLAFSRVALWILVGLFCLNTLGNLAAETTFEKLLAIYTATLAVLCLRLSLEKINNNG